VVLMSPPHVTAVQGWIARGRTVCPFGTLAHREGQVRYVRLGAERREAQIWREARAFIERKEKALVLLLQPPDPPTWAAGRAAAWTIWRELSLAVNRINYPQHSLETLRREIERDIARASRTGARPLIGQRPGGLFAPGRLLFTVGMGPQYPREHPRWAPHTLVQATWMGDVDRARREAPEVHRGIQERMAAYAGGLYDADELWVDIMPAVTGQPEGR
jgi:hypothetical protein